MEFRHATQDDLPRIVEIYNSTIDSRQSTADTEPVTVEDRQAWFDRHNPDARPLMVLQDQQQEVVAWFSFESFYGRPAYQNTVELSIYIDPAMRGQGMGKTVMTEALAQAAHLNIKSIVGFVFAHNTPSMRLLTNFGFEQWGLLPDVAEMDGNSYSLAILGRKL